MATVEEILCKAKARIADPARYIPGVWARTLNGWACDARATFAVRWSAPAAVHAETDDEVLAEDAISALERAAGDCPVDDIADHAHLMSIFDRAIADEQARVAVDEDAEIPAPPPTERELKEPMVSVEFATAAIWRVVAAAGEALRGALAPRCALDPVRKVALQACELLAGRKAEALAEKGADQ